MRPPLLSGRGHFLAFPTRVPRLLSPLLSGHEGGLEESGGGGGGGGGGVRKRRSSLPFSSIPSPFFSSLLLFFLNPTPAPTPTIKGLIHLLCLYFKNMIKEMQSEIEGGDQLWTSNATPVFCFFQNKSHVSA